MTVVIVAGDVTKRFTSTHNVFSSKERFGYVTISEETLHELPPSVVESMATLAILPETLFGWYLLVPMYLVGSA